MKRYKVTVCVYQTAEVEAESEERAREIALDMSDDDREWDSQEVNNVERIDPPFQQGDLVRRISDEEPFTVYDMAVDDSDEWVVMFKPSWKGGVWISASGYTKED